MRRVKVEVAANQDGGITMTRSDQEDRFNEINGISKGVTVLLGPGGKVKVVNENVHSSHRDDSRHPSFGLDENVESLISQGLGR